MPNDKHIYSEMATVDIDFMCRCGETKNGFYDCEETKWECPNCGQTWSAEVIIKPIEEDAKTNAC